MIVASMCCCPCWPAWHPLQCSQVHPRGACCCRTPWRVGLQPALFYSDRPESLKHFELRNTTMLVQPSKLSERGKVPSYTWEGRMRAAHEHALLPRCDIGRLLCEPESPQMRDGSQACLVALPPSAECCRPAGSGSLTLIQKSWDLRWQVKRETARQREGAAITDPLNILPASAQTAGPWRKCLAPLERIA